MVKNGQEIRSLCYAPSAATPLGLELLTFDQLRTMPVAHGQVVRGDFHVLAHCTTGTGRLTVDFVARDLVPGTVAWVRPGWTHRWDDITALDGHLMLCRPELVPAAAVGHAPAPSTPPLSPADLLTDLAFEHLVREYAAVAPVESILRHLVSALTLRVAAALPAPAAATDLFDRFARLTERYHTETREVSWYAAQLGYSPRTLTRAVHLTTGRSAKQYLNDRVALEAKRLLAQAPPLPTATCARRLGFEDAANFTKFFRTHTGTTPTRFRRANTNGVVEEPVEEPVLV